VKKDRVAFFLEDGLGAAVDEGVDERL